MVSAEVRSGPEQPRAVQRGFCQAVGGLPAVRGGVEEFLFCRRHGGRNDSVREKGSVDEGECVIQGSHRREAGVRGAVEARLQPQLDGRVPGRRHVSAGRTGYCGGAHGPTEGAVFAEPAALSIQVCSGRLLSNHKGPCQD